MQPPVEAIQTEGHGPDVVFIHGTGRTRSDIPVSLLRDRLRVTTYDRRGTARWPLADGVKPLSVEEHASDAADVILGLSPGPVHICGMSFGGVVVLELVRRRPELVRSIVLYEPPVPSSPRGSARSPGLLTEFNRLVDRNQPRQAAEFFCRRALSDATWERLPPAAKRRARSMWPQIHGDLVASAAYKVRYRELGGIATPVLLLRGGRSRARFDRSIRALSRRLPRARVATIEGAAHDIGLQGWREFATMMFAFVGA